MLPVFPRPVVMVVDDEKLVADTLARILQMHRFQSHAFYSCEALLACTICPQLAILDVIVPGGMNGIDLAIILRGVFPGCRILLMSGAAETDHLLDAAKHQGHHFEILAKPFHPRLLIDWMKLQTASA